MTETSRRCMGQAIALVIVFGHAVSAYGQDEASEWRYYGGDAALRGVPSFRMYNSMIS